jgi:hypothetical protein
MKFQLAPEFHILKRLNGTFMIYTCSGHIFTMPFQFNSAKRMIENGKAFFDTHNSTHPKIPRRLRRRAHMTPRQRRHKAS